MKYNRHLQYFYSSFSSPLFAATAAVYKGGKTSPRCQWCPPAFRGVWCTSSWSSLLPGPRGVCLRPLPALRAWACESGMVCTLPRVHQATLFHKTVSWGHCAVPTILPSCFPLPSLQSLLPSFLLFLSSLSSSYLSPPPCLPFTPLSPPPYTPCYSLVFPMSVLMWKTWNLATALQIMLQIARYLYRVLTNVLLECRVTMYNIWS